MHPIRWAVFLVPALATVAAAQGEIARARSQSEWPGGWPSKIEISSVRVEAADELPVKSGTYRLILTESGGGITGRLTQQGQPEHRLLFATTGCSASRVPAWSNEATSRVTSGRSGNQLELRIEARDMPGCALIGRLPLAGDNDPVPGGRPDPGGPDQFLVKPLADLMIRGARPIQGDPKHLNVRIANLGPGPSGPTQLKMFYHRNGKVLTAQAPTPGLGPKQQAWVKIGVGSPLPAADSIGLRVDDPNTIAESNELNNSLKYK